MSKNSSSTAFRHSLLYVVLEYSLIKNTSQTLILKYIRRIHFEKVDQNEFFFRWFYPRW